MPRPGSGSIWAGRGCHAVLVHDLVHDLVHRAPGAGGTPFGGAPADQLVEHRLPGLGAQDASQALDVLPGGGAATDDDRHVGVRDVHALVEHASGDQLAVAPGAEALQDAGAAPGSVR